MNDEMDRNERIQEGLKANGMKKRRKDEVIKEKSNGEVLC